MFGWYGGGCFGILALALAIYTIYLIINSSADSNTKLIWILIVIFLPIVGSLLYMVLGQSPRSH
jgi:cobalamin synthase